MQINEVKNKFIEYFKSKQHEVVPSSTLLPKNDTSIMFTNAGMNQFKDVFMGLETRSYKRATSIQKCVRAGGKHNDLEVVGKTARHHTFFEMLGNFSFGDYFKKDAIKMAWELLTEVYKINPERLYITVHESDNEAYEIWNKDMNIPKHKIYKMGDKDNFWSMGDTGPCGPSSEIFYDHGKEYSCGKDTCDVGCECDRFVEIWNLVFMQYNRTKNGVLESLPKKSVDTGAGVERITAVLQGVVNNYDIKLFKDLKNHIAKTLSLPLMQKNEKDKKTEEEIALNVIADHIRSLSFLITDGGMPSNEGTGYVLRRIIRRAVRYGNTLGAKEPFLYKLVDAVVLLMGKEYPELKDSKQHIEKILKSEEKSFFRTLENGLKLIEENLKIDKEKNISAEFVFKLYDTYGFPIDLTKLILEEQNINIDEIAIEKLMEKQRNLARASKSFENKSLDTLAQKLLDTKIEKTKFIGYEDLDCKAKLIFLEKTEDAKSDFAVIFDKTPFYAESGGQVADSGFILKDDIKIAKVIDVQKPLKNIFVHYIKLLNTENIDLNKEYKLIIDKQKRSLIARNHTTTHILHYLLRKHLGKHVKQAGSFVSDKILRFDFIHTEALKEKEINLIEEELNLIISDNETIKTKIQDYKEALKTGAMALFDEKYEKDVRVVSVGNFSEELCGGTHIEKTSEIGLFKIKSEVSIAAGVRRIEALTSSEAYQYIMQELNILNNLSKILGVSTKNLIQETKKRKEKLEQQEKILNKTKKEGFKAEVQNIISNSIKINNISVIYQEFKNINSKDIKGILNILRTHALKKHIFVLYLVADKKITLFIDVSKDLIQELNARDLFGLFSKELGLKGGGSPEFVQAGGLLQTSISSDFEKKVIAYIKQKLGV